MRLSFRVILTLTAFASCDAAARGQATTRTFVATGSGTGGPSIPVEITTTVSVVAIGKILEIDPGEVEVVDRLRNGSTAREVKTKYKVGMLQIDESVLGGSGLTRIRFGFPVNGGSLTPPWESNMVFPQRVRPKRDAAGEDKGFVAGMEGCFYFARRPNTDFYVIVGSPLLKGDEDFKQEVAQAKKVAKFIDDPVAALKAKDLYDRFQAANVLLSRYKILFGATGGREPIPDEENKLIVALLIELPWKAGTVKPRSPREVAPSRETLWHQLDMYGFGYRTPKVPARAQGDPPLDFDKFMDEATLKFLKENGDKIKIQRTVFK